MKLDYRVIGLQRKALVGAISSILNLPTHYLGAPSFAYEVGDYHIDKGGALTGQDNRGLEDSLHQLGFDADADSRFYDGLDTDESGLDGMGAGDVLDTLTIQVPRTGFTPEKLDNLAKLVRAKAPLLEAALDADELPIQQTADTLDFPWFRFTEDSETVNAYSVLISLLCKAAKEKTRVTAKECEATNPKYGMRCFLLSLGFIGAEYKIARKILLSRLDGNSSWKSKASVEGSGDNA